MFEGMDEKHICKRIYEKILKIVENAIEKLNFTIFGNVVGKNTAFLQNTIFLHFFQLVGAGRSLCSPWRRLW